MAERYAQALFELGNETNSLAAIRADLARFSDMVSASPELRLLIGAPVFSADEQLRALHALLKAATIGGLAANFLQLVARSRRLFAVMPMIAAFGRMVAKAQGISRAEVISAQALSDAEREETIAMLAERLGGTVEIEARVDPRLLGGMIVKTGSRVIDASLRTRLESMKRRLIAS
jgi:F-type H+-transporting ATPase subunit delta